MTPAARPAAYSVVVPVRNEVAVLPQTVPALLAATERDAAEIVYVCSGCTDGSAETIRALAGARALVVELPRPARPRHFPRFYLDADVVLGSRDLADRWSARAPALARWPSLPCAWRRA